MTDQNLPPSSTGYAPQPLSPSDAKLWASLAVFGDILSFLPALLIFLILKDRSELVRTQAKEALNWAITVAIAYIALAIVGAIFTGLYIASPNGIDGIFALLNTLVGLLQFAIFVVNVVFSIIGGVRVNGGGTYRFPFALRLIK